MSVPATASCPTCDGAVPIAPSAVVSELIKCRECGTDLEITSVDPPAVAEAPMEEEDWGQ
jgi:alpha-aminoadipate/glutamate carrier protein LysW